MTKTYTLSSEQVSTISDWFDRALSDLSILVMTGTLTDLEIQAKYGQLNSIAQAFHWHITLAAMALPMWDKLVELGLE